MPRVQAIEFEDFTWFPSVLRDSMTDFFNDQMTRFGLYDAIVPRLARLLDETSAPGIVDLCSGGGGPHASIAPKLEEALGRSVDTLLTDKYPNLGAFARLHEERPGLRFMEESVDATDVPERLRGVRTLFSAFHHFPPHLAVGILADAVTKSQPIAIFELSHRGPSAFAQVLLGGPIGALAFTPFVRPFRLSRLLLTYVVPAIPFFMVWDGVASNLRAYGPDELRALIAQVPGQDGYAWDVGVEPGAAGARITYLVGRPRR